MKTKIITLLLLLNASAILSQNVNILGNFNGDFESGITNWRFFEVPNNIGSRYELTTDAISGNPAMKLIYVADDSGVVADRGFDNRPANVRVIPGTAYTLKAFLKSNLASGLTANILVGFFDSGGGVISPQYGKTVPLTSTYAEHEFTVSASRSRIRCLARLNRAWLP
ncbi:MAG: hypothetical protein Q7J86_09495 [Bacteroidota bacterium]|nr:hypothetical protein [Bacteroidota bacterium]